MPRAKSKVTGKAEFASLLAELTAISNEQPEVVPVGWKTCREWAAAWSMSARYVFKLLARGVESGAWEYQKFRVRTPVVGKVYLMPHYRPKAQSAKQHTKRASLPRG